MISSTLRLLFLLSLSSLAMAETPKLRELPKHQTPLPIPAHRVWHITQNLGPIGARGWIYGSARHTDESREILVKSMEPGSPAHGVLLPYDVIYGAAVPPSEWISEPKLQAFNSDARLSLARAITWAESNRGKGELQVLFQRDGQERKATITIPVLGDYHVDGPANCPKSQQIVKGAARFLAENMPASGYTTGIGQPYNGMLMLATEDPTYLDQVRRTACRMSIHHEVHTEGKETWRWGPSNLFLCEYYLATGDARVLPTIQEFCTRLANGQCNPGTWGHITVPNFIPPGYGSLNASGVVCFLSMVLGEFTGVEVDRQALANSTSFFGGYAGRGSIPYGDHLQGADATSNGKNGMAAVAFNLLRADNASQWFARMCCSANLQSFEGGHSGNYFNQTWTPLGASLTGEKNYAAFWSRFHSYRDLARRWDGSFMTQPWPHGREGDLGTINYVSKGPIWSTGGFALSYLAGGKSLAILGRRESVFSTYAPEEFGPALKLYQAKNFEQCLKVATPLKDSSDARIQQMAAQLVKISQNQIVSLDLTLADMQKALAAGDLYQLKYQLTAVGSIINESDPRLAEFQRAIADPKNENVLADGERFHRDVRLIAFVGPKGYRRVSLPGSMNNSRSRGTMKDLSARDGSPYQALAKAHLAGLPKEPEEPKQSLLSQKNKKKQAWKMMPEKTTMPKDWSSRTFNDRRWDSTSLPLKIFSGARLLRTTFVVENPQKIEGLILEQNTGGKMKVFLNGTLILDIDPKDGESRYNKRSIPLKPSTAQLLQKGPNIIAVALENTKDGSAFDFDLKAALGE